jgi:hypothetical protein
MRGNEVIQGVKIRCYDYGENSTADRYTIVFIGKGTLKLSEGWQYEKATNKRRRLYPCLGMSGAPFHPQGIAQHSNCVLGAHLGKRVALSSLPQDCQTCAGKDIEEIGALQRG